MDTEKSLNQAAPSPALHPGQPAFPPMYDTNMQGPNMYGGPTPGGPPYPPLIAFGPAVPGTFGVTANSQGGSGYEVNPAHPPYYPPGQGFNGNINSKYFHLMISSRLL